MIMGSGWRGATVAGMLMAAAVGGMAPLPGIARATGESVPSSGDALAQEVRIATIGYRLARGAATRCATPENMAGIILHDIGGYAQSERTAIAKALGWTGGFGVRAVVASGAGDRAGLRAGDEIVALDAIDLTRFAPEAIGRAASFDRSERFTDLLGHRLRGGGVRLTVRRDGVARALVLTGDPGCATRFAVAPDRGAQAYSDGAYVAVTPGMLALAPDDAALAFVLAHEMAHVLLGHVAARHGPRPLSHAARRMQELAADRLAVTLLRDAGFPPEAALVMLAAVGNADWRIFDRDHPPIRQRLALIRGHIEELRAPQ